MISHQNKSNFLDLISRPALSMRTEKHKANKKEDMSNENQQHFNMWGEQMTRKLLVKIPPCVWSLLRGALVAVTCYSIVSVVLMIL